MNWKSPLPEGVILNHSLYKYRSIRFPDGSINTYTQSIFAGRGLWFDKPASFNDPFDCNLKLWTSKVPEHIVENARQKALEQWPTVAEEVIEAAVQSALNKPGIGDKSFDQERKRIYEHSSVFCWADSGSNIAMFAYYADSHKGICMEFEVDHRHLLGQVMPVIYSEHLPNLDYSKLTGTNALIESLLLTKAKCWQHENERRVIRQNEPPGLVSFPPQFLARVIFGCRSPEEDIELVKSWLVGWPTLIKLARAVPDDKSFTMRVEDFEILNQRDEVEDSPA